MRKTKTLMAQDIKCNVCGDAPTSESLRWQLVEPAITIRRLAIEVNQAGEIAQIRVRDLTHDDGDGETVLEHTGCLGTVKIPEAFWDFDVYG